jgi:hypothetical protein
VSDTPIKRFTHDSDGCMERDDDWGKYVLHEDYERELADKKRVERENEDLREVLGKMLDEGIGEHAMRAIARFALKARRVLG